MEGGRVRAILVQHLGGTATARDPTDLVPSRELETLLDGAGPAAWPGIATNQVTVWARTFPTLVAHLRGRPERALALFAEEVYPFLRGDRLAARVEASRRHHATIRLAPGLPDAYQAHLVAAFVGLSGAQATTTVAGPGLVELTYRTPAGDKLARLSQAAATWRLPLVWAALGSGVVGVALAAAHGSAGVAAAVLTLVGMVAAQAGANGLHDWRRVDMFSPLAPFRPGRTALIAQAWTGYAVAAGCGVALLVLQGPEVIPFAAAGLLVGFLWYRLRERGLGPAIAAITYGPIGVAGAAVAAGGPSALGPPAVAAAACLAPGLLAAAALHLDDLADRPLDEAGGQRTLAVRLPGASQAAVYAALVGFGAASAGWVMAARSATVLGLVGAASLVAVALLLALRVHAQLAVPRGLAAARVGSQALHAAACLVLAWTVSL